MHIEATSTLVTLDAEGYLSEYSLKRNSHRPKLARINNFQPSQLANYRLDYNEFNSVLCLSSGSLIYIVGYPNGTNTQRCIDIDEGRLGLSIDCLKFSADGVRLAVCLSNQSDFTAPNQVRIYAVPTVGVTYDLLQSIDYESSAASPGGDDSSMPPLARVTSLDWSKDSEYLRFTTSDFRKFYVKRHWNEEASARERSETYEIDNYCMHALLA